MGIGQKNKPKEKKCRNCKDKFMPTRPFQSVCSVGCSIEYGKLKADKVAKQAKIDRRKEFKANDVATLKKTAQTLFNKYIRQRDGAFCISCGEFTSRQIHAGHFRTVGAAPQLRFNTWNCHSQCSKCNNYLSGNLVAYKKSLVKKIGIEKVEWLESQNESKKYTVEYLTRLIKILREKLRRMQ